MSLERCTQGYVESRVSTSWLAREPRAVASETRTPRARVSLVSSLVRLASSRLARLSVRSYVRTYVRAYIRGTDVLRVFPPPLYHFRSGNLDVTAAVARSRTFVRSFIRWSEKRCVHCASLFAPGTSFSDTTLGPLPSPPPDPRTSIAYCLLHCIVSCARSPVPFFSSLFISLSFSLFFSS